MPSSQLMLCCPLLLLPSMFPSIRVFSSESALQIRLPEDCSFSFSISLPVNIQGWFSLGLTGLISLLSKGLSKVQHYRSKASILWCSASFGLLGGTSDKEAAFQFRRHKRHRLDPESGRFSGGGHGNPFQYSCLENLMDGGACQAAVLRVTKNWTGLKRLSSQPSLRSNSHIHTRLPVKPCLWLDRPLSAKWCLRFLGHYLGLS